MNQFAEAFVLVVSVCVSWFCLSQVFIYFGKKHAESALVAKVHATSDLALGKDDGECDVPAVHNSTSLDDAITSVFEHYELFGASLGTWSLDATCDEVPIHQSAHQEDATRKHHEESPHVLLFEHYGLFGADVGVWSGPSMAGPSLDHRDERDKDTNDVGFSLSTD